MRFRCSLVVTADDFTHREGGVIEAANMSDAMDKLIAKAPEPPDTNPAKISFHVVIERLP